MKIVKNNDLQMNYFKDVKSGECFIDPDDNALSMKLYNQPNIPYNAIDLQSGCLFTVADWTEVTVVNSCLVVI